MSDPQFEDRSLPSLADLVENFVYGGEDDADEVAFMRELWTNGHPTDALDALDREIAARMELGTIVAGRFVIQRKIAQGGMGQIFQAIDLQHSETVDLNKFVALKRPFPGGAAPANPACWKLSPDLLGRFEKERAIASRLDHMAIAPIFESQCEHNGIPYYAMRFVDGKSLHEAIKDFRESRFELNQLPYGRRAWIESSALNREFQKLLGHFTLLCDAVVHIHAQGVIHRDIKPPHCQIGNDGETMLFDFGLAIEAREFDSADVKSLRSGTREFMAPEQLEGKASFSTDIFALGATLYCILAGVLQPEYSSPNESDDQVARASFFVSPNLRANRPSRLNPRLPRALESICIKAMSPPIGCLDLCRGNCTSPRYESAADLRAEVENWLQLKPVTAHRESWKEFAVRNAKKYPAATIFLLLAAIFSLPIAYTTRQTIIARAATEFQKQESDADQLYEQGELVAANQQYSDLLTSAASESAKNRIDIKRVRCMFALGNQSEIEVVLNSLRNCGNLGSRHREVQLLWGYFLCTTPDKWREGVGILQAQMGTTTTSTNVDELIALALIAPDANDESKLSALEKAERLYRQVLVDLPKSTDFRARLGLATTLLLQGNFEEASTHVAFLRGRFPKSTAVAKLELLLNCRNGVVNWPAQQPIGSPQQILSLTPSEIEVSAKPIRDFLLALNTLDGGPTIPQGASFVWALRNTPIKDRIFEPGSLYPHTVPWIEDCHNYLTIAGSAYLRTAAPVFVGLLVKERGQASPDSSTQFDDLRNQIACLQKRRAFREIAMTSALLDFLALSSSPQSTLTTGRTAECLRSLYRSSTVAIDSPALFEDPSSTYSMRYFRLLSMCQLRYLCNDPAISEQEIRQASLDFAKEHRFPRLRAKFIQELAIRLEIPVEYKRLMIANWEQFEPHSTEAVSCRFYAELQAVKLGAAKDALEEWQAKLRLKMSDFRGPGSSREFLDEKARFERARRRLANVSQLQIYMSYLFAVAVDLLREGHLPKRSR